MFLDFDLPSQVEMVVVLGTRTYNCSYLLHFHIYSFASTFLAATTSFAPITHLPLSIPAMAAFLIVFETLQLLSERVRAIDKFSGSVEAYEQISRSDSGRILNRYVCAFSG